MAGEADTLTQSNLAVRFSSPEEKESFKPDQVPPHRDQAEFYNLDRSVGRLTTNSLVDYQDAVN